MLEKLNNFYEGRLTNMITFIIIIAIGGICWECNHGIIGGCLIGFGFVLLYGTLISIRDVGRQRRYDAENSLIEKDMQALSEYHTFITTAFKGTEEEKQSELLKIQEEATRLQNSIRHIYI
jgi:hypothetical protein